MRESPLVSNRYLVSSNSICAGFFSVSAVMDFGTTCEGESGAHNRIARKTMKEHRLKPVPPEIFAAGARSRAEWLAADGPTQEV